MTHKSEENLSLEQSESCFRELRNHYFGLKYLNSLMRIRDPGSVVEPEPEP